MQKSMFAHACMGTNVSVTALYMIMLTTAIQVSAFKKNKNIKAEQITQRTMVLFLCS